MGVLVSRGGMIAAPLKVVPIALSLSACMYTQGKHGAFPDFFSFALVYILFVSAEGRWEGWRCRAFRWSGCVPLDVCAEGAIVGEGAAAVARDESTNTQGLLL